MNIRQKRYIQDLFYYILLLYCYLYNRINCNYYIEILFFILLLLLVQQIASFLVLVHNIQHIKKSNRNKNNDLRTDFFVFMYKIKLYQLFTLRFSLFFYPSVFIIRNIFYHQHNCYRQIQKPPFFFSLIFLFQHRNIFMESLTKFVTNRITIVRE